LASPGLKNFTHRFESGLIDLAVALDDVDLTSGAGGKCSDLSGALVPAHHCSATVECLNKYDSLVGGHGKAIDKCLVIQCFAPLLKNV
jgi:hypothetical protein